MGITRVTRGWQITLPKDVREIMDVSEGEVLLVKPEGRTAVIERIEKNVVDKVFGAWGKGEHGVKTIRRLRQEWVRREHRHARSR